MDLVVKLFKVLKYFDYGLSKVEILEYWLEQNENIRLDEVKSNLLIALEDECFDWVGLGLETNFLYISDDNDLNKLDVDNLLMFTDSSRWKRLVEVDAFLTTSQWTELKEQFRDIGLNDFKNVSELLDSEEFYWLPFEVKHAYKSHFLKITYQREDVVYHLKKMTWEYFNFNHYDVKRLMELKEECMSILENEQLNEGWVDMNVILKHLKDRFLGLDLYELSQVDWGSNVQHKIHYRNILTLGFKRISPEVVGANT
jgi:hypothetical protein